jgi:hypothetical protein
MIFLFLLFLFNATHAKKNVDYKVCTLVADYEHKGQEIESLDCLERAGASFSELKEFCLTFSEMPKSLGGKASKLTYAMVCPNSPQARCLNSAGMGVNYYYYKKDATSLKNAEITCKVSGGRWDKKAWSFIKKS